MVAMSHEVIAAALVKVLSTRGPLSEAELDDALMAEGIDVEESGDALEDVLEDHPGPIMWLSDDRWAWLPALLDGRVFTHRLSKPEAEHDLLLIDVDLAPISTITDDPIYLRLTDGSTVADVSPLSDAEILSARGLPDGVVTLEGAWLFEPGRFAELGVGAGDLVGVRITPDGLQLGPVGEVATSAIATELDALLGQAQSQTVNLADAIWTLCTTRDDLFRSPAIPLGEELAAAGLVHEGELVARAGFDFGARRVRQQLDRLTSMYDLEEDQALAVAATLRLHDQVRELTDLVVDAATEGEGIDIDDVIDQVAGSPGPSAGEGEPDRAPTFDRGTVGAILEFLAEPAVADAIRVETAADKRAAAALGLLVETVEPMAPRPARPALRWLRAIAHERLGEVKQAEKTLNEAESLDPSWPLTLVSLARYAGDRGDAERALALLRRAGAPPDDEMMHMLEHFQPAPRPDLGRNQPCWCGSGRKYKVCHLHREMLPLAERAAWLYQKAGLDLLDGPFAGAVMDCARVRSEHWDRPDSLIQALDDAIVADAVLFEGGAFAEFLAARGELLPDDERSLAEQWLLVDRTVHEVVSVRSGRGMTMRDVRTGDVHEVREETASRQVRAGQLYCARVVPAAETMQIFGGLEPVAVGERDALIALLDDAPDPVELVAFLSRRFAPPQLRNTEGESLAMCDATLRLADPVAVSQALDGEYDRRDDRPDDNPGWFEHVTTDGMERIRASLELDGDELHIHANSQARFDRVLARVRTLDPAATVLDETREPAGDLASMKLLAARTPAAPSTILDPAADPALAAAMEQFTAQYEKAWLDDPIPALAGYTPRQCAHDPTRRPDLIRLLDSFPEDDGRPGTMSPARLRAALGLG
jgi:tetratricopeptide (TPR) repeat protein